MARDSGHVDAVEEYVYDMRGKIYDRYEKYISDEDRDSFRTLLSNTEDWLYEEGDNQPKQVYVEKLEELKVRLLLELLRG